jgi:hypothetical protein
MERGVSLKKLAFSALAILGFVAAFTALFTTQKNRARPRAPAPAVLAPIEGKLDIRSIDDIRVGGHKILLCGVTFARSPSMRALVTEAAHRDYQGEPVTCKRVGAGTPCDGKMAAKFGDSIVVQCMIAGDVDLATRFSDRDFLCDVPAQSGGRYKACSKL